MDKKIISTAALFGMIAIILGAFGAHKLKEVLTLEQLNTFETGVKYQMYNALFLLFLGTSKDIVNKAKKVIFYAIISGVFLFSVSLYFLAINRLLPFDFRPFGFVTPIGGLLLLVGWFWLFINFYRKKP